MNSHAMRGPVKFLAICGSVILLSAILAPPLHAILPFPFARIFKRLLMVGAILAVLVFVRFRRALFVRFGLRWTSGSLRVLGTGFVTGFATLAVFVLSSVLAGQTELVVRQLTAIQWAEKIASGLLTGILIGTLEEFLFRGAVFTYLRDTVFRGRAVPGAVSASLVYAGLHFLNVRQPATSANPGIADSVSLILAPVRSLADWPTLWPAAVGLFLFGMVLNGVVIRTGSLYPSIGVHAGSVTFLRVVGLFVRFGRTQIFLWGTKKIYDGVLGWTFVLLIGVLLSRLFEKADTAAEKGPGTICGRVSSADRGKGDSPHLWKSRDE